jgi:hypothetical protein
MHLIPERVKFSAKEHKPLAIDEERLLIPRHLHQSVHPGVGALPNVHVAGEGPASLDRDAL